MGGAVEVGMAVSVVVVGGSGRGRNGVRSWCYICSGSC